MNAGADGGSGGTSNGRTTHDRRRPEESSGSTKRRSARTRGRRSTSVTAQAWFDGASLREEWGGYILRSTDGQDFAEVYADDESNTLYRTARWPRGRRALSRSATAWPVCAAATLVGSGGRGFRTPCTVATVRWRNSTERDFFPSHGSKASHMTAELSNVRLSRGTFDKRAYRARPTRWDPTGVARDSLLLDRARAVILWSREQRGIDLRIKNGFELRERMVSRIGSSSAGSAWLLRARVR